MAITPIRDLKAYLEPEQVEKVIAVATNLRDKLLVRIPWRTGIRVSELIGIKVPDIDPENRAIVIKVLKQRKRDGKIVERRRIIPVDQIYWKLGKRAGIKEIGDPAVSKHRKLHPHVLRHSFAIHCIKRGMTIERLQKILGHSSPTTTSVYLQYSLKDLHEDYDKVWEEDETAEAEG